MKLKRLALALILPLLMSGCFLAPGVFTSSLDLKRDGSFTFAYKGEVIFLDPEEMGGGKKIEAEPWSADKAVCYQGQEASYQDFPVTTVAEDAQQRPCTAAEITGLKEQHAAAEDRRLAKDRQEAAQFAGMFGFNPMDEAANAKLAANLMRYEGWRSVSYRGKGVYDVDYQIASKAGHDFIFPIFPQGDILIPFVTMRGQDKGSVRVNAPALIGGGLKGMAMQMKSLGMPQGKDLPQTSRTKGTFTITTEGEILTNNTENGAVVVGSARKLVWDIDSKTEKIPEALIKLR